MLKKKLDKLRDYYNTKEFITNDPVQFPHRFSTVQDVEIVSLIIATISWGNRKSILKSAEKILSILGNSPYDYVRNGQFKGNGKGNLHRTFFERDFFYFCRGFQYLYQRYNSAEELFRGEKDIWDGISALRALFIEGNGGVESKHFANPEKNSACKRIHMALRWLVRNDGVVDLGVWKSIQPSQLMIPLDTHVARIGREMDLLSRKQNDRKAVEELTRNLKELDPIDPVGYDFALFGYGISRLD